MAVFADVAAPTCSNKAALAIPVAEPNCLAEFAASISARLKYLVD